MNASLRKKVINFRNSSLGKSPVHIRIPAELAIIFRV